jgi:hypothetical protein
MNPSDFVTCTIPCAIAAGNVDDGKDAIQIAEPASHTPRFREAGRARGAAEGLKVCRPRPTTKGCEHYLFVQKLEEILILLQTTA